MKLKSILFCASAILLTGSSFAQSFVSTSGKKNTMIEEATGVWCGWCPDGAQVIEQQIEPNYPHVVIASWHGYNGTGDPMILPRNPAIASSVTDNGDPFTSGSTYITGFPNGTVNRDATSFSGGIQQDRTQWIGDINTDTVKKPNFDIYMKSVYDPTNDSVTVVITAKALVALSGTWNVNVLITEDSISSGTYPSAYNQHSYLYTTSTSWFYNLCTVGCGTYPCTSCAILPTADYSHMNVVRAILAQGASPHASLDQLWGDQAFTGTIAAGSIFIKTYGYKIPSTSVPNYTKVIGMVQKFGSSNTDRVVENSVMARVRLMSTNYKTLEVNNLTPSLEEVSIFPNPAKNNINVAFTLNSPSETKIKITDIVGKLVFEKSYAAGGTTFSENISVGNFSNGTYFMNITNNDGHVVKEFTVSK